LITLSTRAQVESKKADTSALDAVRHIIKREGITGLYAGIDSALFGISLTNFVYYYCKLHERQWFSFGFGGVSNPYRTGYEWTRAFFEKAAIKAGRATKKLNTFESMAAGAVAGSLTVLITNPIWVVNTRMTAGKSAKEQEALPGAPPVKKPGTIAVFTRILKEEGLSGFFAGVLPALVLVINPILQYTLFEQLKNALEKRRRVTPTDSFYLGALGKLAATSITYPYITVKSRMHVAGKEGKEDMTTTLRNIIKNEGVKGLYGGIGSKVTQSVLTAAFLFAFKDALYGQTVKLRSKITSK
jgi:adenine nucleotide transporter 17